MEEKLPKLHYHTIELTIAYEQPHIWVTLMGGNTARICCENMSANREPLSRNLPAPFVRRPIFAALLLVCDLNTCV